MALSICLQRLLPALTAAAASKSAGGFDLRLEDAVQRPRAQPIFRRMRKMLSR